MSKIDTTRLIHFGTIILLLTSMVICIGLKLYFQEQQNEQLKNLFEIIGTSLETPLVAGMLIYIYRYFKTKDKYELEIKDLKERLETKTEWDRLRYKHEKLLKEYKGKDNDTSEN